MAGQVWQRGRRLGARPVVLLGLALALAGAALGCSNDEGSDLSRFDWESWRAPNATAPIDDGLSARQRISDELFECGCVEGTDRDTLVQLMGKPDDGFKVDDGPEKYMGPPTAGLPPDQARDIREAMQEVEKISDEVQEGSREVLQYTLGHCTKSRCLFTSDTEYLDIYIDLEGQVKKIDAYGT